MEYEFYFPKTKSKHMATPVTGKVYPSKGGTVRYGIQATMNGSMSLPKYVKEEEFNRLGFGAETYDAEIEGNVEYERMEERTVDVRQEIEQPFSVQTDPAEYEHEYPEDIENAIKHGIHKQLYDNPDSKLAREGGFIENIETDVEVVDLEDDPDSEPRELTAYGNLGKPEVNDEEEYYRQAKITDIEKEFRNEGIYEATSGSGMINHDAIDKVIERPAIMRYNHAFTDYDWDSDEDLDEFEENLLKEEIVDAVGRSPDKGSKNLFIDVDNKDVYVSTNTNHGEGRFYGFDAETFDAESGQMCEVCFEKDDMPYDSDHFTECRRCGKSVCIDCEGEMENHPEWSKVCAECSNVLDNVHDYGAETVGNPSPISPLEETPATVPSPAEPTNENFSAEGEIYYSVHYTTPNGDKIKHNEYYLDDYGGSEQSVIDQIEYETNWFDSAWETATITKSKVGSQEKEVIKTLTYESENFESQNSNMKLALGLTGLGIGLAFWKGKEIMSLWDSITSRLKK